MKPYHGEESEDAKISHAIESFVPAGHCPVTGCGRKMSPKQNAEHGVCKSCQQKIKKRYDKTGTKDPFERESRAGEKHYEKPESVDPLIFFDELTTSDDSRLAVLNAISKYNNVLLTGSGTTARKFFNAANALSFAAHTHPACHKSGEEIARGLRMTKQAFFLLVNHFRDRLALPRIAGISRRAETRKVFKQSAKKHYEKRIANTKSNDGFAGHIARANLGS